MQENFILVKLQAYVTKKPETDKVTELTFIKC